MAVSSINVTKQMRVCCDWILRYVTDLVELRHHDKTLYLLNQYFYNTTEVSGISQITQISSSGLNAQLMPNSSYLIPIITALC